MNALAVEYLNHASVVLHHGDVSLLSDPWFSGTAFNEAWGLRYRNPQALARAGEACTHLWISHWHSDHLHAPTLEELARRAPRIQVLANVSSNFSMLDRLRELGFANIIPFHECETRTLGPNVRVTRYPAAGIDNVLLFEAGPWTVLNYNDCNLPAAALRALLRRLGPIGLLLANYNHPPQLLHLLERARVKRDLAKELLAKVRLIQPRVAIPFASEHYFRSPYARERNDCLLRRTARAGGPRAASAAPGGRRCCGVRYRLAAQPATLGAPVPAVEQDEKQYGPSVPWSTLLQVADSYCARVKPGSSAWSAGPWPSGSR